MPAVEGRGWFAQDNSGARIATGVAHVAGLVGIACERNCSFSRVLEPTKDRRIWVREGRGVILTQRAAVRSNEVEIHAEMYEARPGSERGVRSQRIRKYMSRWKSKLHRTRSVAALPAFGGYTFEDMRTSKPISRPLAVPLLVTAFYQLHHDSIQV